MKKAAFLALFCLSALAVHTQDKNLLQTWNDKKQADTTRLEALQQLVKRQYLDTKPDSALYYAQSGYALAAKKKLYRPMAGLLLLQGQAYTVLKDTTHALECLQQAQTLARAHHLKTAAAQAVQYTGDVYFKQRNYDRALSFYLSSIGQWKTLNDKKNLLLALQNEGRIYNMRYQYDQMYRCVAEMHQLALELDDKTMLMGTCFNLGRQAMNEGDLLKGYTYYEQLLQLATTLNDSFYLPIAHSCKAAYYRELGDYAKSIAHYQLALDLVRPTGNRDETSRRLLDLANVYMLRKDLDKALALFNEAMDLARATGNKTTMAMIDNSLGGIYSDKGKHAEAIGAMKECILLARELKKTTTELFAMNTLGKVFNDLRQYDSTLVWSSRAMELARSMNIPRQVHYAEMNLSLANFGLHRYADARQHITSMLVRNDQSLRRSFPVLSEKEQEAFFSTISHHYTMFYTLTYGLKNDFPEMTGQVYNTAARNKGLLLRSSTAMRQSILSGKDTALARQYNQWIELNRQITKNMADGKDTKEMEERANALEKQLVKGSQVLTGYDQTWNITWQAIQAGLGKNEAAIEFVRAESIETPGQKEGYFALVVKPGMKQPQMIFLCSNEQLAGVLGKTGDNNAAYISTVYGTRTSINDTLYTLLWEPLEKTLKGTKTVYLSPDGLLHKVSFPAIARNKNTLLCDVYDIRIQGSTAAVAHPESAQFTAGISTTVFGGIEYSDLHDQASGWSYLEGTKTEADRIVSLLQAQHIPVDYFAGRQASETSFKNTAGKNTVLHIATHGFFFPDPAVVPDEPLTARVKTGEVVFRGDADYAAPGVQRFVLNKNPLMRSGLVLAGANDVWKTSVDAGEKEDGVLTAQEVTQMDLRNTRLVVLSACETGLGDIRGSEGVYGLQRSFRMAGAHFLIMSLWQVPDNETREFMVMFYEKLLSEKNIRKAFSATQKAMRAKYDPYYWAAFVLVE